jgi:chromosome segregation ATPase
MDDIYGKKFAKRGAEIQNAVDDVLYRFSNLATFHEAIGWHSDVAALIRLLDQFCSEVTSYRSHQEESAKQVEAERSSLTLLKRTFASRSDEKQYKENINSADKTISSIESAKNHLQDLMDRTPRNKTEQSQMIQALKQHKKELTTEKKAINEGMRQTRIKARQDMTSWTGVSGKGFVGSVARYERVRIRNQKENALAPKEDAKTIIEKQVIEIDKNINRISKIAGNDLQEKPIVFRCVYCGRRVEPNSVCPGCGSDKTVIDS